MKYCCVVLLNLLNNKMIYCLKNFYLYERFLGDDSIKKFGKII